MQAAIYSRVSADELRERRSVGEQEQECRQLCAQEAWNVVRAFSDNDRSASRFARRDRPGYNDMVHFLESGNCDVLVLWESSRGDRELERWAGLLNLCRRIGIRIHIVSHGRTYDLDKARDWRTLAEDGVDSAYESEKTRERVMRAVGKNASLGRPHGKLLYGYTRVYDKHGRLVEQVTDEAQASIIREVAQRVADGESCYAIARNLNDRGVPAPKGGKWDLTQVKRIVVNPAYIGKRVHQGKIIGEALWPAILDETLYWTCSARLNDPVRRTVRDGTVKHLLSGIALCGICGDTMRMIKNRGVLSYSCGSSFHVSIPKTSLEDYIRPYVRERFRVISRAELDHPQGADSRRRARVELAQLSQRLEDFTREAARGNLTASRLGQIERELSPQIADARQRANDWSARAKQLVYKVVDNPEAFDELPVQDQRQIINDLFIVEVLPIGRGRRGYDLGDRVHVEARRYGLAPESARETAQDRR